MWLDSILDIGKFFFADRTFYFWNLPQKAGEDLWYRTVLRHDVETAASWGPSLSGDLYVIQPQLKLLILRTTAKENTMALDESSVDRAETNVTYWNLPQMKVVQASPGGLEQHTFRLRLSISWKGGRWWYDDYARLRCQGYPPSDQARHPLRPQSWRLVFAAPLGW